VALRYQRRMARFFMRVSFRFQVETGCAGTAPPRVSFCELSFWVDEPSA